MPIPTRSDIEIEVDKDLAKDPRWLLVDVHQELLNDNPSEIKIIHAQKRLASLFVTLYRKSEESTDRIIKLTKWLAVLTVVIIILTLILIIQGFNNQDKNKGDCQQINYNTQQNQIPESQEKSKLITPQTKENEIKRK